MNRRSFLTLIGAALLLAGLPAGGIVPNHGMTPSFKILAIVLAIASILLGCMFLVWGLLSNSQHRRVV